MGKVDLKNMTEGGHYRRRNNRITRLKGDSSTNPTSSSTQHQHHHNSKNNSCGSTSKPPPKPKDIGDMGLIHLKQRIERGLDRWGERNNSMRKLKNDSSTNRASTSSSSTQHQHHHNSNNISSGSTSKPPPKPMDMELYKATIKGDVDKFVEVLTRVSREKELSLPYILLDQVSPLRNTCLHLAVDFQHYELVGFIAYHCPSLLTSTNVEGDTPLHLAARAADTESISLLVQFGRDFPLLSRDHDRDRDRCDSDLLLLGAKNRAGNTPLHEFMMNHQGTYWPAFLEMDTEVAFYYFNNELKSPFYVAVESGDEFHVDRMLPLLTEKGSSSIEDLKKGKSPVHAAIRGRHMCTLDKLLTKMPALVQLRDEKGETPLHCAASIGYLEGVQYLLHKFSDFVLARDDDGFLPVHLASGGGHVVIVQRMLQHCPDWKELLTDEGENILHVAAMCGRINVVDYILKTKPQLANDKDDVGNTPLHLAAINWHPKVVSSLTWNKRVNLEVVNHNGMTALDVAEEYMGTMASFRKRLTWMALKSGGVPRRNRSKNSKRSLGHYQPNMKQFTDRINTLLLVSTLVATVTFAAGFTMPGGYNNTDPDQGMATMLTKTLFQVFVICDAIAMYSSIIVVVSLIWAQLGDIHLVLSSLRLGMPLLGIALSMMSVAFMAGVSLVISKLHWLAIVVLVMGNAFLAIILTLYVPLFFPNTSKCRPLRHISYYFFCLMMMASGSYKEDHGEY